MSNVTHLPSRSAGIVSDLEKAVDDLRVSTEWSARLKALREAHTICFENYKQTKSIEVFNIGQQIFALIEGEARERGLL